MSEAPLMNDEAARSTTGEILDQATVTETKPATSTTTETPATTPSTTTTETKSAETKPTEGEKKPDAPAVPEKYEFKAPENYTLDPKLLETVTPLFKELGLTNEQAQKLVDIQIAREIAATRAPQDTYEATRTKWQAETTSHPDIKNLVDKDSGKTGIDAVKIVMGRALNAIGDPALATEFKAAMDLTGAGDNPAFVRTFLKLADFVTEGKHVAGKGPSIAGQREPGKTALPTAAQALYPGLPSAG